jgi:glucose-6-phosphate isomerase
MSLIKLTLDIPVKTPLDTSEAIVSANRGIGNGDERWRMLWHEPMQKEHLQSVQTLTEKLQPNCVNFLLLGIGGSSLGAKALQSALGDCALNFFVLDNIDPHTVQETIDLMKIADPTFEQTVVTVISKSGDTAEITSLLMVIERTMPAATFVAITGSSGTLREVALSRNWDTLLVPDGVGGRFSILSPVGLFPAAMCGIDVNALLDGAREMDDACKQETKNPAADLAAALVGAMQEGRNIHIMMPYCDRLIQFAHWYVQLWAESLGKITSEGVRVGPTPIAAIGATDQHSMLQLWREGPMDKVIGFLVVDTTNEIKLGDTPISASQAWLCDHTIGSLLHAQQQATQSAMQDANQATWTLTLATVDASSVGQFIALWQATVAIAGRLLHVNPYNQPGVELGKQLTRESLKKIN